MDIGSLKFANKNPCEADFKPGLVVGIDVLPIDDKRVIPKYLVVLVDPNRYLDPNSNATATTIIAELHNDPKSRLEFPKKYGVKLIGCTDIKTEEYLTWREAFNKFIQAGKEITSQNVEWITNYAVER